TLLPETVVEPPLHRAQLALRYAIRGPRAVRLLRVLGLREVRQVLQANALVVDAVAGDATEIVRAAAEIEDLLADLVGFLLLGMGRRDVHLHAARLRGHVSDERIHHHLLARAAIGIGSRLLRREALQRD